MWKLIVIVIIICAIGYFLYLLFFTSKFAKEDQATKPFSDNTSDNQVNNPIKNQSNNSNQEQQ